MSPDFGKDLTVYVKAGYPILNIVSSEEDRVLERVDEIRRDPARFRDGRELFIWTVSRGWLTPDGQPASREETRDPAQALQFVRKFDKAALFLLKDFHPYLDERAQNASLVVRLVRDLAPHLAANRKTMLWVSPVLKIPPELEKDVTVLDMPLPAESEYREILESFIRRYGEGTKVVFNLDDDGKDLIVKACQGLTKCEAENALAKAIVGRGRLDVEDVRTILEEKEQIIRKSGILEYWGSVDSFGDVGGLANLKAWLRQRNQGFGQKARDFGLPFPRGVLLVGVPGCGKSLCAKAVAAEWKKPLLKFDLGRVFGSLVGESEERMRKALGVAEGVAPAVLWIDELEKGLSGHAHLRQPADVDGGEEEAGLRGGHRKRHLETAAGAAAQGAHGRDLFRGPAHAARAGRDPDDPSGAAGPRSGRVRPGRPGAGHGHVQRGGAGGGGGERPVRGLRGEARGRPGAAPDLAAPAQGGRGSRAAGEDAAAADRGAARVGVEELPAGGARARGRGG